MGLRKRLDREFERGRREGFLGGPRDPGMVMCEKDAKYIRWARAAGNAQGRREMDEQQAATRRL